MAENGSSRGEFLAKTAGVAGLAIGAGVWATGLGGTTDKAEAATRSTAPPEGFALEIDGILIGLLKTADGGHAYAEVVQEKLGTGHVAKKHLANVKYEDISMKLGFSMSKAIYDWISASWNEQYARKNGAIQAADFKRDVKQRFEFFNALITEVGFPACDASAKDPAYLSLKLSPEFTRSSKGSGKLSGPIDKAQKKWLPSNFKFELGDLPTKKVSKIEAFTVKQQVTTGELGDIRDYEKEPAQLEFPDLKITIAEVDIGPWAAWFDSFVIKGMCADTDELDGRITFLAPDRKTELASVELQHCGIFKMSKESNEANADKIKRFTVELYVERMVFRHPVPNG